MLALMCHLTPTPYRSRDSIVRAFIRAVGPDFLGGGPVERIRDRLSRKVKRHLDQGYGHIAKIARASLRISESEQDRGRWQAAEVTFAPTEETPAHVWRPGILPLPASLVMALPTGLASLVVVCAFYSGTDCG
jgi:phage terminase large subunit-like protein